MPFTNHLRIRNSTKSNLLVVIEPWANEIVLAGGEQLEVMVHGPDRAPPIAVEWSSNGLIVWAGESGSTCDVFKEGVLIA